METQMSAAAIKTNMEGMTSEEQGQNEAPNARRKSLSLKILVVLAILYTLYFTSTLMVPIVVAAFVALFASRLVRLLLVIKIPRPLGAALVIVGLVTACGYTAGFLAEPASRWLQVLPVIGDEIAASMEGVSEPLNALKESVVPGSSQGEGGDSVEQAMDSTVTSLVSVLAETTLMFLIQLAGVVVITYFFLVFGDELMRNVVRAQNTFSEKKTTVIMFQTVQDDISRYVLVISIINLGLGVATAGVLTVIGVEDALLWGTLATILNFAPYVGPFILSVILTGVGFVEFDSLAEVLMVPGLFLILNFFECQFITPTVLGQRFNMNPLLVVLWMFAWGWLWGAVGMLIAIPLLMCFKILAIHLDWVGSWIKVLDGISVRPASVRPTEELQ